MNINNINIEELLEKYFDGETSLEEEKYIIKYFQNDNINENLFKYKPLFNYIDILKTKDIDLSHYDNHSILNHNFNNIKRFNKKTLYFLSGIAATIIIFVLLFNSLNKDILIKDKKANANNNFNTNQVVENQLPKIIKNIDSKSPIHNKKRNTVKKTKTKGINNSNKKDYKKEYNLALNTLIFVSNKLNSGLSGVKKVSKFNEGLEETSKLSNYEKYQNNLIKFINN
jgi:hypothetical protein